MSSNSDCLLAGATRTCAVRTGGRMDLVIAIMHRTAILNLSRLIEHDRRRQRPDWLRPGAARKPSYEGAVRIPEGGTELINVHAS
jgi:hypothetical protein